ncbi:uncharacterized protein CXorf51A-like [Panthera pardus]|uniref:Uncharacterized protein CXorf51A-like n=1 Tax=Panthera pardus TaxID=9691 RepID=A0A9W2UNZ8_PANPR|nr:uncharacterized protein CXorf51A-like [Panthera tigris]XP_049500877.1 uncharacterized protein CXorf51A-like [Panthera uncia]XP_053747923.1 uncharacterized protein CXorf51A-like [Panthera pardus]XP_060484982.1 uncharacterized protein CXorf51A-like [Panthera onca]
MAKAARKTQNPPACSTATQQSTSGPRRRKPAKTPRQPKSGGSGKVTKPTIKVKRQLRGTVTKKAPLKTPISSKKVKKGRGTALFGHYRRMNKAQNPHDSQWDQPSTSKVRGGR